jgi:hypothetical protein
MQKELQIPLQTSLHMAAVQAFDAQFLGRETSTPASLFLSQLSATISQRMSTADLLFGDCFNPNYCQSSNMLPLPGRH